MKEALGEPSATSERLTDFLDELSGEFDCTFGLRRWTKGLGP